jgi:hypothetical protein
MQMETLGSNYVAGDTAGNFSKMQALRGTQEANEGSWAWATRETGYGPLWRVNPNSVFSIDYKGISAVKDGNSQQFGAELGEAVQSFYNTGQPNSIIQGWGKNSPLYTNYTSIDPATGSFQPSTSGQALLGAGMALTPGFFSDGAGGLKYNTNTELDTMRANVLQADSLHTQVPINQKAPSGTFNYFIPGANNPNVLYAPGARLQASVCGPSGCNINSSATVNPATGNNYPRTANMPISSNTRALPAGSVQEVSLASANTSTVAKSGKSSKGKSSKASLYVVPSAGYSVPV